MGSGPCALTSQCMRTCDRRGQARSRCKRCLPFAAPVALLRALPLVSAFSPYAGFGRSRGRSCRPLRFLCSQLFSSSTSASSTQVPLHPLPHTGLFQLASPACPAARLLCCHACATELQQPNCQAVQHPLALPQPTLRMAHVASLIAHDSNQRLPKLRPAPDTLANARDEHRGGTCLRQIYCFRCMRCHAASKLSHRHMTHQAA